MREGPKALIESLGVYLPPRSVTTKEIIAGCARKVLLPIEHLTGIKSRRMAGQDEFSYDLAVKAVEECLAYSKYSAEDIDLVICCNISRFDGPDRYSFEPSTAVRLRTAFGIHHAMAFDVTNACAGMFTGIYLANALISAGAVRRGLVISGEYITHVTETAQKEIYGLADPLLACLTLGDAGAAVLVDGVTNGAAKQGVGLHAIDLFTLGKHSELCTAKVTEKDHGGAIMNTDMIGLAKVAVTAFLQHAALTIFRLGWAPNSIQHVIPHQTSKSTLDAGSRSVQRAAVSRGFDFADKLVINVAERGNTATTSHFVALKDNIINGRINSGDSILFGILASGITIGTAIYRLDDLPDRIRTRQTEPPIDSALSSELSAARLPAFSIPDARPRVRAEALGFADENATATSDTLTMLTDAGTRCIESSAHRRGDIDLILSSGVYRTDYLSEPAIASLLAGRLGINDAPRTVMDKHSLAFDVLNGGLGFLEACCISTALIRGKNVKVALIATSEVENNAGMLPDRPRGIFETGAAMIVDVTGEGDVGFGAFAFQSFPEHAAALDVHCAMRTLQDGGRYRPLLIMEQEPEIELLYAQCATKAAEAFLSRQGLKKEDIAVFLPPQISPGFIDRFSELFGVERSRCVDVTHSGVDLFTATLPYCLSDVLGSKRCGSGEVGLIINVAAGLEVGCATYHF